MSDCLFCKIVNNEIPCYKIYEDNDFLAFLDISQFVDGHTLIIPKKHYDSYTDVVEFEKYFSFAKKVSKYFKQKLGYKYVDLLIFGRMIYHSHIHLIPHNDDNPDWEKALSGINYLSSDLTRRKNSDEMISIMNKFKLNNV